MYLQDYQLLGGIFVPKQVLKCDESRGIVIIRGSLLLNDKDYHITIVGRKGRLTKITKVAGETIEKASTDKQELNLIRAQGIQNNTGGLRNFVVGRILRTSFWYFLMFEYLICLLLCSMHIAKKGITLFSVVGIIVCIIMASFSIKMKSWLIMERRGLKVYSGEE